jgi:PAS domain S-box-containing protein
MLMMQRHFKLNFSRIERRGICMTEKLSTVRLPLSFTADSLSAVTATCQDVRVSPGNPQADAQSSYGRELDGSELPMSRYRGLLEAAPDAMVVVNQGGEIVLLNVQAEKQFGYHRDELVGQKVKNIIPEGFAERLIADGTRSTADALAQQIGTGIELYGRRRDESEFPVEIMLSPLESAEGILVIAAIRDISVRKDAEKHLAQIESRRQRVENELRESEERYQMLLDGIQTYAIFMMDPVGQILSWNAGAERIKGYSADQIIGHNFSCFFPPEDIKRGRPEEILRVTAASGRHEEQGMRVRKDGSRFLASVTFTALRDPAGNLRGFSEFSHDLSESKESEAKYRGLLEAAPDAMVVVNQGGEIVLLNVQAEKQFGYSRDELVGQKVKNIIPEGFAERLIADGTRTAADALAQQIGAGIELIGRRKDCSEFPIEIMLSPLENAGGILVTAAIRNISVRKEAERRLVQMTRELSLKHQLLNSVVEGTTDPIYVRGPENRFTLANSACSKVFGLTVDQVVGRTLRELLPSDSYYAVAQSDQDILSAGDTRTVEETAEIDGIVRTYLTTKGPYRDADQKTIGTIGIARDITERKNSELQLVKTVGELKRSNDELQQFAYVASHDLQEPLRMVASYTQLLGKRYKGRLDSDADEFIAFAVDGCNRMQRLIQDLLAYSRAGTTGKVLREISGEDALKDALTNLRATIEQSGAVVTHDSLPAVTTDGMQLTQVFQNLVGNAIKYRSAAVPHVHISAVKNRGKEWIFAVQDNGLGIDPRYFERIFILFQRLHGRDEFEGTGIGLAICKKLVEQLGGRIWVESLLGKGSTFYFVLPERNEK